MSDSLVICLRSGNIATSYVLLRTVQEISNRIFVTNIDPKTVGKKLTPGEVRQRIEVAGYPHWRSYYDSLCDVAHQNPDFIRSYWKIQPTRKRSQLTDILVEECLATTNLFCAKSLGILYDQLAPYLGQDAKLLKEKFAPIEKDTIAMHRELDGVVERYIEENKEIL